MAEKIMRAKKLIPILAEAYGIPFEVAFAIDRSLSENGFRAKGKGRSWPEMNRREAVHFLIGCMVADKASRAADHLSVWVSAVSKAISIDTSISAGVDESIYPLGVSEREDSMHHRAKLMSFSEELDGRAISLVDYLLQMMPYLKRYPGINLELKFSPTHLDAVVIISTKFCIFEIRTFHAKKEPVGYIAPDPVMGKKVTVSVNGEWLLAIASQIENPLLGGK